MLFASIIGKQVFATLNPLLALMEQGNEINRIVLMPTMATMEQAEKIRLALTELGVFPLDQVSIKPVSSSLEKQGQIPSVLDVLKLLESESGHLIFNIAGGMNFMVAACAAILEPDRSTMLYPDKGYIYQVSLKGGQPKVNCLPLPSPLAIFKLFELQGIECVPSTGGVPQRLRDLLKLYKAALPGRDVISGSIGGISFDAIWNDGNTLKFLVYMAGAGYNKDDLRRLIAFSSDRTALFDLLHREIGVISDNDQIVERLAEARNISMISLTTSNGADLKRFMGRSGIKFIPAIPHILETGHLRGNGDVLLTPLGEDPSATMTAIYTHRPGRAIVCYTTDNNAVMRTIRTMTANPDLLPDELAEIHFVPVSMAGDEILLIEPLPDTSETFVNITPGLKSHGFFLAVWGALHGAKVYSLENQKQILSRLNGPPDTPSIPLTVARPRDFLTLRGEKLRLPSYKSDISKDRGIKFLFELVKGQQPGPPDLKFPGTPLPHPFVSSRYIWREKHLELCQGKERRRVPAGQGAWFELLIGYALARAGATKIDAQIIARWGDVIEKRLIINCKKKDPTVTEVHRTEIDIACVFGARYVVVSCKAWDPDEYERDEKNKNSGGLTGVASEVKSMAALFGRFALPMMAFYGYNGEPYQVEGITLFGFQTYSSPDKLKIFFYR